MAKETEKSAIERVQTARHPDRPYSSDLFSSIFEDFVELHGDRRYADDPALLAGFAKLGDHEVLVVGQQKGRDDHQGQGQTEVLIERGESIHGAIVGPEWLLENLPYTEAASFKARG